MEKKYIPRLFDQIIEFSLKSKGAVVVVGPKWCGKSTTAARYAKTLIDLMPLENREDFVNLAKIAPSSLLNYGPKPILIDEWQHISFIWDQVKYGNSVIGFASEKENDKNEYRNNKRDSKWFEY